MTDKKIYPAAIRFEVDDVEITRAKMDTLLFTDYPRIDYYDDYLVTVYGSRHDCILVMNAFALDVHDIKEGQISPEWF